MYTNLERRKTCSKYECRMEHKKRQQREYAKIRNSTPEFKEYQRQYHLKNKPDKSERMGRDNKKRHYEIDKNDIKYYIVDEQYNIIGYKLHDNGMTNSKQEFLKSAS